MLSTMADITLSISDNPENRGGATTEDTERFVPTYEDVRTMNRSSVPTNCGADKICAGFMDLKITGLILLLSGTAISILMPVYIHLTLGTPVTYLFPPSVSLLLLYIILKVSMKLGFIGPANNNPLSLSRNVLIVIPFGFGYLVIMFSQIPNAPCNILDPLKFTIILFAVVFSALFWEQPLRKWRKLSYGILLLGLFVIVKYGMCFHYLCYGIETYLGMEWKKGLILFTLNSFIFSTLSLTLALIDEYLIRIPVLKLLWPSSTILMKSVSTIAERNDRTETVCLPDTLEGSEGTTTDGARFSKDYKNLAFTMTFWIIKHLILVLIVVGMIHLLGSATLTKPDDNSMTSDSLHVLACHFGVDIGYSKDKKLAEPEICPDNLPKPVKDEYDYIDYMDRMNIMPLKSEVETPAKLRTKRSTFGKKSFDNLRKKNRRPLKSKHAKRYNINIGNNTAGHHNEKVKFIERKAKNILRKKRTSFQTNALGFKIIQPTDSILQGHVITNKLKPNLVGHIILNKTSVNLNGHTITYKQDLFIREHDPQTPKMHRLHRGRLDMRFVNDMKPTTNPHNSTTDSDVNSRAKREVEEFTDLNDVENSYDNNINKNGNVGVLTENPVVYDMYENNIKFNMDSTDSSTSSTPDPEKAKDNLVQKLPTENEQQKLNSNEIPGTENYNYSIWKLYRNGRVSRFDDLLKYQQDMKEKEEKTNPTVWERVSKFEELKLLMGDKKKVRGEETQTESSKNNEAKIKASKSEENIPKPKVTSCGYIPFYGWAMVILFLIFSVSTVRFLIITQSAQFTMGMMIPALPLTEIWWGLIGENPDGSLGINVIMSIELICSLLGLPIILAVLILQYKTHVNQRNAFEVRRSQIDNEDVNINNHMYNQNNYRDGMII